MPISPRSQSEISSTTAGDYLESKNNGKVDVVGRKRARAVLGDNGLPVVTQKEDTTPANTEARVAAKKAAEQALSDELTAKVRDAAKKAAKGGTAVNRSMFN